MSDAWKNVHEKRRGPAANAWAILFWALMLVDFALVCKVHPPPPPRPASRSCHTTPPTPLRQRQVMLLVFGNLVHSSGTMSQYGGTRARLGGWRWRQRRCLLSTPSRRSSDDTDFPQMYGCCVWTELMLLRIETSLVPGGAREVLGQSSQSEEVSKKWADTTPRMESQFASSLLFRCRWHVMCDTSSVLRHHDLSGDCKNRKQASGEGVAHGVR